MGLTSRIYCIIGDGERARGRSPRRAGTSSIAVEHGPPDLQLQRPGQTDRVSSQQAAERMEARSDRVRV